MIRWLMAMSFLVGGCAMPEAPDMPTIEELLVSKTVYGDEAFTPVERAAVEQAVERWQSVGAPSARIEWTCESPCQPSMGKSVLVRSNGTSLDNRELSRVFSMKVDTTPEKLYSHALYMVGLVLGMHSAPAGTVGVMNPLQHPRSLDLTPADIDWCFDSEVCW